MGELSERLRIAATPDVVYELVDDPTRFAEWQPYVALVADIAGRPEGIGTSFMATYRVFGRRLLTRWVITGAEHGRLLETTGTTSGGWAHWRFGLEPAGDATLLSTTLEYELPGPLFFGPVALVAQAVLRRRLYETIRNLGRLAEVAMLTRGARSAEQALPVAGVRRIVDATPTDAQVDGAPSMATLARPADDPAGTMARVRRRRELAPKSRRIDVAVGNPVGAPTRGLGPGRGVGPGQAGSPGAKQRQVVAGLGALGPGHDDALATGLRHDEAGAPGPLRDGREQSGGPPVAATSRVRRG